jgi:hypothetical protein
MASLLDPRTKGGLGIPKAEKAFTYATIKEIMILIAQQLNLYRWHQIIIIIIITMQMMMVK